MDLSEKQIALLKEKLADMSPEELESLQSQQEPQGCPFCMMHEGKIPVKEIYADKTVMAVLDIHPAAKGHTILFPRSHYETSFAMNPISLNHLFSVMNEIGKHLGQAMQAQGVNYFMANGEVAGQHVGHFIIHIIPRFKGDGIQFQWNPQPFKEEEAQKILSAFKSFRFGEEQPKKEVIREYINDDERVP